MTKGPKANAIQQELDDLFARGIHPSYLISTWEDCWRDSGVNILDDEGVVSPGCVMGISVPRLDEVEMAVPDTKVG